MTTLFSEDKSETEGSSQLRARNTIKSHAKSDKMKTSAKTD